MPTRIRKQHLFLFLALTVGVCLPGCKSGLLGFGDETAEAGKIVKEANEDLRKIRVLYVANEDKRDELRKALEANDAAVVRRVCGEIVDSINDGTALGQSALEKLDRARDLEINREYSDYLRYKWDSLNMQLAAFNEFKQAARVLRDNYDPQDSQARDRVVGEFKRRNEEFQKKMEQARDDSSRANELAQEVIQRERSGK
jgi:hypothetical protein